MTQRPAPRPAAAARAPDRPAEPAGRAAAGRRGAPDLGAAFVVALALAHVAFLRFVCDDAFISFRYARNLAHGHGLVFNPGERVEGYTNFLWTLVLSLVARAGGRPEDWAQVLGAACALGTVLVVVFAGRRRGLSPLACGVPVAASTCFAAWGTGGLETSMFTLFVTGGVTALALGLDAGAAAERRQDHRLALLGGALLGLACLTRPDGLLVAGCAGAVVAWSAARRELPARVALGWFGLVAAIVAPHFAWRLSYYGRWLPNSFAVKSPGAAHAAAGLRYLGEAALDLHLYLLALPLAVALATRRAPAGLGRRDLALAAAVGLPYVAYVASTGGDFMPAYRFVAPLVPLGALVSAAALTGLLSGAGRRRRAWPRPMAIALVAAYALLNLRGSLHEQDAWARGTRTSVGWARADTRNWLRIGAHLREVTLPGDTLATTAAGAVPYASELPTIDLLGLNAPDLSVFRRAQNDRPGHSLQYAESLLVARPPQILLGHPLVRPSTAHIGFSLDLDPAWRGPVMARYDLVGLALRGEPRAYVGCLLRKDVSERIIAAGRRAGGTGP